MNAEHSTDTPALSLQPFNTVYFQASSEQLLLSALLSSMTLMTYKTCPLSFDLVQLVGFRCSRKVLVTLGFFEQVLQKSQKVNELTTGGIEGFENFNFWIRD
ncbi:hypothetical protein FGO68_gene5126 [Halteria grandinella]|uniref:Uncharacterized protein n=1 Tax=Halteria grandinella TaxID=5974 RepID=A0A8J8NAI9_HALGN|nr:hypothetical protein FGO68_gene5126 [Halteria grandinella]